MGETRTQLTVVAIALLAVSWVTVSLRVVIRGWMIKAFGPDDWLMLLTLALFTIYNAFVLLGISYGTGKHTADLTTTQVTGALKAWFFCEIFYILSTCTLKIAIGSFLLRVTTKKSHRYLIYALATLSTVYSVVFVFIVIFQCKPTWYFWNRAESGHCVDPALVAGSTYGHAAISAIVDWTFGILPLFIVHDLQMNRRMKISVALLLCFANIGSIATLVRIKYIKQLTATTDFLFATVQIGIWSSVEPGIGIAAASIATYRPLFRSFFNKMDSLRSGTHHSNHRIARHDGPAGPNSSGYKRTTSNYIDPHPYRSSTIPTTSIIAGHTPKGMKKWGRRNEEHEMEPDIWKINKNVEITSSEHNV